MERLIVEKFWQIKTFLDYLANFHKNMTYFAHYFSDQFGPYWHSDT